jgi:hypothetical protein
MNGVGPGAVQPLRPARRDRIRRNESPQREAAALAVQVALAGVAEVGLGDRSHIYMHLAEGPLAYECVAGIRGRRHRTELVHSVFHFSRTCYSCHHYCEFPSASVRFAVRRPLACATYAASTGVRFAEGTKARRQSVESQPLSNKNNSSKMNEYMPGLNKSTTYSIDPSVLLPGGILISIHYERSAFSKNNSTGPSLGALVTIFYPLIRFLFDTRIEYCSSRYITPPAPPFLNHQFTLLNQKFPIRPFVPPLFPRNKCPILNPKFPILNPQSTIINQKFPIPHLSLQVVLNWFIIFFYWLSPSFSEDLPPCACGTVQAKSPRHEFYGSI